MWEIEDFREYNPKESTGIHLSRLDHINRLGAANGETLGYAYESIENTSCKIACFSQIPFPLVDKETLTIRPGTSRLFEMHLRPAYISISDDGSQNLLTRIENADKDNFYQITQAICFLDMWGMRGEWYPAYKRHTTYNGLKEGLVVPKEYSWLKDHRPLDAKGFETDLCQRLMLDNLMALKRILPPSLSSQYSIINNFFIMPFPGRVAFKHTLVPTVRSIPKYLKAFDISNLLDTNYQSVFLSYGAPDTEIAESLRQDLDREGVKTWWFPKNAQWGERLSHEISANVNKYDRLVILCSRRSLIRDGVLNELDKVLSRENREGGTPIIIPIMLDDVLESDWWKYEPNSQNEPCLGKFDSSQLSRRKTIAMSLRENVAGDLRGALPGSRKWSIAIKKLKAALDKSAVLKSAISMDKHNLDPTLGSHSSPTFWIDGG
jgi:hypothetical protein